MQTMQTREKLKKILMEWADFEIPALCPREFDRRLLAGSEILAVIGARRTGKTYLCYQLLRELRKECPLANVGYINLEDERLHPLKGDELTLLWEVYQELFPVDRDKKVYLVVDEIQNAAHWSKWARRIVDQNKNLKLIVTGSSSQVLSSDIATELRGRTLTWTVYPLSFREYLGAKNHAIDAKDRKNILYSPQRFQIKRFFNEYLRHGGFPATLQTRQPEQLLKEYYRVMFYRDLVERYKIENLRLFDDYLTLLMDQIACHCSISATALKLAEFGHSFSKNTLSNYSRYAQDVFLLFEVKKYSYKVREQLRSPKKIYVIDHGLAQAVRFSFSEDYGRMLENIVFLDMKRTDQEIYYHRGERECDLLVVEKGKVTQAIQVARSMEQSKTRTREIEGLLDAMKTHHLSQGIILTEDKSEELKIGHHRITILPVWYWLLS